MKLNWANWFYGFMAALIGGGAAAVTAGVSASMLAPGQFNLETGHAAWSMLKLMGLCFAMNGIISSMAYLKQSPLPAPEPDPKP